MKVPILDNRTEKEIYTQMIALAKQYVPQWNTQGEDDVGTLLYRIFAQQLEDTVKQYNNLPYRNMLSFLICWVQIHCLVLRPQAMRQFI